MLQAVAAANGGIFDFGAARAAGYTEAEIRARVKSGAWVRLRRGQYVDAETQRRLDDPQAQVLACRGVVQALENPAVVSHESAACLLGLDIHPAQRLQLSTTQVTMLDGRVAR